MYRCCKYIQSTTRPVLCVVSAAGIVFIELQMNPCCVCTDNASICKEHQQYHCGQGCSMHHVLAQHTIGRCTAGLRICDSVVARAWLMPNWLLCHPMLRTRNLGDHSSVSQTLSHVAVMHMKYCAILLQGKSVRQKEFWVVWCCTRQQTAAVKT